MCTATGILEFKNLQHICIDTRGQIRCMKSWLSVTVSSCIAMSTSLNSLYLDTVWLKYRALELIPASQCEAGLCDQNLQVST